MGSLVILLLQIFSSFWQWNNFKNRLIFGKVEAYKNCAIFGPPCIIADCYSLFVWLLTCTSSFGHQCFNTITKLKIAIISSANSTKPATALYETQNNHNKLVFNCKKMFVIHIHQTPWTPPRYRNAAIAIRHNTVERDVIHKTGST